jgi:two-component system phosphate regulon sensor histidine kinase PhoR
MFWPFIALSLTGALVALHLWWRARMRVSEARAATVLDRAREEQAEVLHQVQVQQEAVLNGMTEGLLILDRGGRVQLINRALGRLFGITEDIRSHTLMEALRRHELAALVQTLGPKAPVASAEIRLFDPSERILEVNAAALLNAAGESSGAVLVFHEVTRLKQVERARKDFVANVSHELRTPLSLIKGYVETLLDGARDNPEVAEKFLRTIDRNAERLRLLIDDLLTISELESGRLQLQLQPLRLPEVVDKVLVDLKPRTRSRGTELRATIPELAVNADPVRLEQVLSNLIENAIKYGRAGGHVLVSARVDEKQQVECSVADDGPGIPPEALERIFERFYRVDKARSREQGGTGLGLSIVKHIVQSHEGRVWAKSEVGKGATFYFTLPMAPHK